MILINVIRYLYLFQLTASSIVILVLVPADASSFPAARRFGTRAARALERKRRSAGAIARREGTGKPPLWHKLASHHPHATRSKSTAVSATAGAPARQTPRPFASLAARGSRSRTYLFGRRGRRTFSALCETSPAIARLETGRPSRARTEVSVRNERPVASRKRTRGAVGDVARQFSTPTSATRLGTRCGRAAAEVLGARKRRCASRRDQWNPQLTP